MTHRCAAFFQRPHFQRPRPDFNTMDVLTEVLSTLRLTNTLYCRSHLTAPWGLRFEPSAVGIFHVVDKGQCWLKVAGVRRAVLVAAGDLIVLPHGRGHELRDDSATPITSRIHVQPHGPDEMPVMRLGGQQGPLTTVLCGTFTFERGGDHPLVRALPPLIHLHSADGQRATWLEHTLAFLADEADSGRPGGELLMRRLADIMFIQVVRSWVENQPPQASGWLRALRDAQISRALDLIHHRPEQPWSVADLASAVALSRSAFAAKFTALVGEPPLQYLTRWRLLTAADILQRDEAAIAEVAGRVGYESEAAFNTAFKRQFRVTPGVYRRQASAAPPNA